MFPVNSSLVSEVHGVFYNNIVSFGRHTETSDVVIDLENRR